MLLSVIFKFMKTKFVYKYLDLGNFQNKRRREISHLASVKNHSFRLLTFFKAEPSNDDAIAGLDRNDFSSGYYKRR